MNKAVFSKYFNSYRIEEFNGESDFHILATFLSDDFTSFSGLFLRVLKNDESPGVGADCFYMDKRGKNTVALGCNLDEYPDPNEFRISKDKLITLLEEWMKLYRNPSINEITLTYDEDAKGEQKVILTGRFVDGVEEKLKSKRKGTRLG